MRILMLVNWKIEYCTQEPGDKQPPDYYVEGQPYWFYRYFNEEPQVDVIDISSFPWLENIEKNKIRFYIWQSIRAISKMHKYDLIVSHGMQSGVVLSLWRRIFKTKAKHIVFDIGSFNSAAESGFPLRLMQFASKSIDGLIYHTSSQINYYKRFFPWVVDKSEFIKFGTDLNFFSAAELKDTDNKNQYIICVGYSKRDWDTLVEAYKMIDTNVKLRLVGHVEDKYNHVEGVEQIAFISIKDLINQIHNALFAVLPLEYFNYSYGQMTLMQQMALEKCVIVARVPSMIDYARSKEGTLLYEPKNIVDLAKKIEFLIHNPLLSEEFGTSGRKYLLRECNEITMANAIEKFLNNIVEV